MELQK
jgi:hypothetical protein